MLLDRMSLSIKNEWYDDSGRVYIYYTVDEGQYLQQPYLRTGQGHKAAERAQTIWRP